MDESSNFWIEEVIRGQKEVLIIMFGADPRGSIEVASYTEKAAWKTAIENVNSMLRTSLEK